MRRFLRTVAILALCLTIAYCSLPCISSAETDWRTLYINLLATQQSQLRARRVVALIDLTGDGIPEMAQFASVKGESRTCRLSVYTVKSGAVVQMTAGDAFDFSSVTFPGVRSASFALRATSSLEPCLSISVKGVSNGVTTTTRLAFVDGNSAGKLNVALYETRAQKRGKSVYTVSGASATPAQYSEAYSKFASTYVRKGSTLPYQTFASSSKSSTVKSGLARLASRYKAHSTISRISLSKTRLNLGYGKSYTLKASLSPASAIYESCTWSSSEPGVIKVENGVLTALDVGSATITVKASGGAKKSCKVTVTPPDATSVKISGDTHTVVLKKALQLSVTVLPEKASQSVRWSSANSSVVSVSNGVVTAKKVGTTTVRAKTSNGKISTFSITVLAEELNKNGAIIDISQWNTVKDWGTLRKNVAFVILRCGVTYSPTHSKAGQMGTDEMFNTYASKCLSYGIPFGVYYYGYAATTDKARQEAEKAFTVAKKYNPLFYAYDAEEAVLTGDSIEAFAGRLRELGVRKVGCYIAHHRYSQYGVDTSKFDFIWIPHYGKNTGEVNSTPSFDCDLHQYSSRGVVNGMKDTTVDVNRLMGKKPLSFFIS